MVLLSGLTLAFVLLLIAGAAAAVPKDTDSAAEQRAAVAGHTQVGAGEDIRPEEVVSQNRRAKRGRSNGAFGSSEEEEEPFWAARGRRGRVGAAEQERLDGQMGDQGLPRHYGLRWVFPQKRAVGSSEEDEAPFWASRGRRCCNQGNGANDLKRGYGKDRVRALVAKIIAGGSGGTESEDGTSEDDVFWAARGKRRREEEEAARRVEGGTRPRL